MQPYVNPYLFSNPSFGNYAQPQFQQQPIQQPMQQIGISGRYVNDFGEISASDIPMNGPAIFAKNDRSEIQIREWSPNGQIVTTLYKPYFEPKTDEVNNVSNAVQQPLFDVKSEVIEPIFERISALEDKLDKLGKPSVTNRAKKDGE